MNKSKKYLEKALAISIEIGDRNGEASCYANIGTLFQSYLFQNIEKFDTLRGYRRPSDKGGCTSSDSLGESNSSCRPW